MRVNYWMGMMVVVCLSIVPGGTVQLTVTASKCSRAVEEEQQ